MSKKLAGVGAAALVSAAVLAPSSALAAEDETMFRVEVTNVSKETGTKVDTPQGAKPILLSPGAFAVYSGEDNPAFTVGAEATLPLGGEGLENIAEDGFPMQLAQQFEGAPMVSDSGTFADEQGPKKALEPGMSASFTVTASPGGKLTLATMFVPSNDAFYGPADGIELFDAGGEPISADVTDAIGTFDAGTEENQPFFGPATKPVQPHPDFGPVEESVVLPVEDVEGQPQVYPEVGQVINVTVMPVPAGGVPAGAGGAADDDAATTVAGVAALGGAALLAGMGIARRRAGTR
ncbi:spondin domain-containing protein [Blastococcus goldschmidtiae]|uniref:Spondin domain-containing protein n=1 Tax=Blastococcus goldschmidtiae TaxID=3075546 RepID=A0ABU2K710_9ACTN|nr:spondin domain-containing protein [Blastococcus sp. DSM 46792]MDT0275970.1 spondin domain-containing protein [Blastococcus sp. DSM 46792]